MHDAHAPVAITLDRAEVGFLLTVLRSTGEILTAVMAIPDLSPPPISTDAIVNIAALAEKIELQVSR